MFNDYLFALLAFASGYLINIFYITVLYHRALSHGSVTLNPIMIKLLSYTGIWVTGLDPKGWAAMHRLHHQHSDTQDDPHSPIYQGVLGVWIGQYLAYKNILKRLADRSDEKLNALVKDIPFDLSFVTLKNLSNLPYALHILTALAFAYASDSLLIGFSYFVGIMGHPIQGWMVNALAHRFGHRNFETEDNSRNNLLVAFFIFGEGLQNNHHANPGKANFSHRVFEPDLGYWMCPFSQKLGLLKINKQG